MRRRFGGETGIGMETDDDPLGSNRSESPAEDGSDSRNQAINSTYVGVNNIMFGDLEEVQVLYAESDSESGSLYEGEESSADGDDEDVYEEEIAREVEWGGVQTEVPKDDPLGVGDFNNVNHLESDHGGSIDGNCSDFIDSSDEESQVKYTQFNPKVDMKEIQFKTGMLFSSPNEFRCALRDYAIKNGKQIRWIKNDGPKLRAGCGEGCNWEIYVSRMQDESTMQVKYFNDAHTCHRVNRNKLATSTWIASKYLQEVRFNPKIPIPTLREKIQVDWVVFPSKKQLSRARRKARDMIEGSDKEQYGRLYDYLNEIATSNPDTTTFMKIVDGDKGEPVFQRLYVCLGALKKGMKEGCRPIIGLDGAHLKGTHTGQVLIAVGLDGNNQSYPFAYAIVEGETKETWKWFLAFVREDLEIGNSHHWTFISDKQKGLTPALAEDFPHSEHRFCVKHMYSNFMTENKGLALKLLFYKAAQTTTEPEFESVMYEIKTKSKEAYEWLNERDPRHWCKAFFNTDCKTDLQINNNCESLNGAIKDAREKAILTLLDRIRELLMERGNERRIFMSKYFGKICPNVQDILEKLKIEAGKCTPKEAADGIYQIIVVDGGLLKVNLNERTCGCRKWQLTGIPCSHAISAIYHKMHSPEDYVSDYYLVSTYMKPYEGMIYPINGPALWKRINYAPPLPPYYRQQPGRPRRKSAEEIQSGRKKKRNLKPVSDGRYVRSGKKVIVCGNCGLTGHNARSCKNSPNLDHQRKNLPRWKDKSAETSARAAVKTYASTLPKNKGGRPKKRSFSSTFIPPHVPTTSSYAPAGYSGLAPDRAAFPEQSSAAPQQSATAPQHATTAQQEPPTTARGRCRGIGKRRGQQRHNEPAATTTNVTSSSGAHAPGARGRGGGRGRGVPRAQGFFASCFSSTPPQSDEPSPSVRRFFS